MVIRLIAPGLVWVHWLTVTALGPVAATLLGLDTIIDVPGHRNFIKNMMKHNFSSWALTHDLIAMLAQLALQQVALLDSRNSTTVAGWLLGCILHL